MRKFLWKARLKKRKIEEKDPLSQKKGDARGAGFLIGKRKLLQTGHPFVRWIILHIHYNKFSYFFQEITLYL